MGKGIYRMRRNYLISKRFQLRYVFYVLAFMFMIAWLSGYTVYYTLFTLMGEKLANVYPQGRLMDIFKTVNTTLLLRIALIVPFVVMISILITHRIAGPIFSMQRYLGEVAKGNFSSILKLRKRDELKDLAAAINKMTHNLGMIVQENRALVAEISDLLGDLNSELGKPSLNKDAVMSIARNADTKIKNLKGRLDHYRVRQNV